MLVLSWRVLPLRSAASRGLTRCHDAGAAGVFMLTKICQMEDMMTLRVPRAEVPAELREALTAQLGSVPEPLEVSFNNPAVAAANQDFAARVGTWDAVDASLKTFAHMAVAAQVGCSWCLDINYFLAINQDLDATKASQVPRWRDTGAFSGLERDVLRYAEAMTNTPTTVTDELSARLLDQLGPAGLVELTAYIGFANLASRANTAHGITSQGYSDSCEIPLAASAASPGPARIA
jgi:alkylhydroperoxidase family enzyme